jgi:transcriptional regulator with XRE-family HTH domain
MSIISNLWEKFAKSKKYREEFVAAQAKRGIPFQARALLKARRGWTQQTLAEKSGLTQGVVSRALNPNYGNLTLNTIVRIAAGFDVAFIGMFVPFSELERWFQNMSEESVQVATFEEENARRQSQTFAEGAGLAFSRIWKSVTRELSRRQVATEGLQSEIGAMRGIRAAKAACESEYEPEFASLDGLHQASAGSGRGAAALAATQ